MKIILRLNLFVLVFLIFLSSCSGGDTSDYKEVFSMGEECFAEKNHGEAMRYYLTAYEDAKRNGDYYWQGKAADRIADLFFEAYNVEESAKYRKETIESYERADKQVEKLRAEYKLASMHRYDGKITQSIAEIDSLMSIGKEQDTLDSLLLEYADNDHMGAMMALSEAYDKTNIFTAILENSLTNKDKIEGAIFRNHILRMKDRVREADSLLIQVQAQASTNEDLVKIIYTRYRNAREDWNLAYAAMLADTVFAYQEAITESILKEKVNGAHSAFYAERALIAQQESKWKLIISGIIILALCSVCFFLWLYFRARSRAHNAEIEAKVEALVSLNAWADKIAAEKQALCIEKDEMLSRQKEVLEQLFKKNWTTLNMLCEEYYEKGASQKIHELVVKKIEKEVKKIGSEEGLQQIEKEVNRYMDGVVDKLREEFPSIKEQDVRFLTLIFAGFSAKAICFILGLQTGNFYVKKSRLIKKIKESGAEHKEAFLKLLQAHAEYAG